MSLLLASAPRDASASDLIRDWEIAYVFVIVFVLLIVPYGAEIAEILTDPARGAGGLGAVGDLPLLDVRTRLTSDRKRVSNVNAVRR